MYRSLFPRDMFAEMDRLQREMQQALDLSPTIRGFGRGGFPALNVGVVGQADDADPEAVEARYRDGVLHITVQRRAAAQPRRITIQ